MDALKDILRKLPYLMICIAFGAKLAWDFYSFHNSPDSILMVRQGELSTVQSEVAGLETKLRQANEFFKNLEKKKVEMRNLAADLAQMKGTFSDELDVPAFIKMVATEAKLVRLQVRGIQPSKAVEGNYYITHGFDLDFRGAYVQLLAFLQRLSTIQNVVRVDEFRVKSEGPSRARFVELSGRLRISAFTYSASVADEKARELSLPAGSSGAKSSGKAAPSKAKAGGGA